MSMAADVFILALFAALLLFKAKRVDAAGDDYFYRLNALRGFFAAEIVIGHVVRYEKCLLYPLGKMMIISVAFFFFVSAYGLARSYDRKEGYIKTFPRQKILYLVLLAVTAFLFSAALEMVLQNGGKYVPQGAKDILPKFLETTNWYIYEAIIFYVLFMVIYSFVPRKARVAVFGAASLILGIVFFLCGAKQGYYSSVMGFSAGLAFYEYREKILGVMKKPLGMVSCAFLTAAGLMSLLLPNDSLLGMVILRNIMNIAAIMLLIYVVSYFSFGNGAMAFLTKISAEIYLFQFPWLDVFKKAPLYGRLGAVLACTVITAAVFNFIDKKWSGFVCGRKKPKAT